MHEQEDLSDLEGIPVLVVDDDEVACKGACILLDDIGMKSEFRLSGPAGIERRSETGSITIRIAWSSLIGACQA